MLGRSDIYFASDDSHRFLPWLMGIMVFLATLLLCLGVSVSGWVVEHNSSYAESFTVNIPADTDNLDDRINALTSALKEMDGIQGVTKVPEANLQEWLKPWLGSSSAFSDLPLPTILEVSIDTRQKFDYPAIQKNLSSIVPGVEVDAHELWVAAFNSFSSAVQSLMVILSILIICGMAMMISFTSRAALKLHAKTVALLHSIGAEDRYITRQFQNEAFRLVMPGALGGALIGGIAYLLAGLYIASLNTSIMPSLAFTRGHYVLLAVMPLTCTLVAWVVARITVSLQLERNL